MLSSGQIFRAFVIDFGGQIVLICADPASVVGMLMCAVFDLKVVRKVGNQALIVVIIVSIPVFGANCKEFSYGLKFKEEAKAFLRNLAA